MARFEGTTTPLDANDEWVGQTLMSDTYDTVVGIVYADEDGTLYVEQSYDDVNWDLSEDTAVSADTGLAINTVLVGPYFRVRYVNGSSAQSEFRLHVKGTAAGTR